MPASSGQLATTASGVSTPILLNNGNVATPAYSFAAETGSGLYKSGTGQLTFALQGVAAFDIGSFINLYGNPLNFTNSGFSATISSNTLTGNRSIRWPDLSGTVAMVSQIPSTSSFVDITTNQTIGGIKTFSSPPVISSITNTGTLTLPTTTGTLALFSQIPTSYVDLTTNQTVAGIKTFSSAPVISSITNTGILTLPTTTGTLALFSQIPTSYVDLTTNQTVAGIKTFSSAPVITTISNTGTLTLPTTSGTLALVSQIPTNSSFVDLTTNQNVGGNKIFLSGCSMTAIGSSTPSLATLYINSGSTAIGGASNYFFTYLDAAITIPTAFTGIASTFTIANAPSNTTGGTGYALNILAGNANFGGSIINSVGAVATPSYTFAGDLTSGLYRIGASNIGISCGGVKQIDISTANNTFTNKITLPNGATATPSLVFSGGTTSGIFYGSSSLKFATSGVEKLAMSSTLTTFASNQIVIPVGSFTVPSISFLGDTTTGLYSLSAGLVNMTCSGALMLQLSSTALDLKALQFTTGAGSATIPSHSFGTDTSTGLYRVAASTIGLTCGGTKQLDLSATAAQFTAPVFSSNQPYFQVGGGGAQSIANATDTVLTSTFWSGGTVSVGSGISYSAGVFTVTNTGTYCINASGTWTGSNTTGQRVMYIFVNNVSAIMLSSAPASADIGYNSISMVYRATAGDTFRIRVFQSSGGAVNFSSGATQAFIINRFA